MTLEDHVGDIIRKARMAAEVSGEEAARLGGLTGTQLAELEENGRCAGTVNYAALAPGIGLDARKLEAIAKGWLPRTPEPARWREIRQITTTRRMSVNCYVVWDEATREAGIFDTGWDADAIWQVTEQNHLNPTHLFITHSHEDHIVALADIRARYPKIRLHSSSRNAPPEHRNRAGDFIHLGSLRVTSRETPGHAEDGVTYVIGNFPDDAPNVAVVGDCIFAGSIGRGFVSTELLKQKIREQIFTLPEETLICPGHGPLTTVGEEKRNNPFF